MQCLTSTEEDAAMEEFSVTLMRTKVTPGTARYDAVGDEQAPLRDIYVSKRAFKDGRIPDLLLVTVRDVSGDQMKTDVGKVVVRRNSR
jgi:hypothetical protein